MRIPGDPNIDNRKYLPPKDMPESSTPKSSGKFDIHLPVDSRITIEQDEDKVYVHFIDEVLIDGVNVIQPLSVQLQDLATQLSSAKNKKKGNPEIILDFSTTDDLITHSGVDMLITLQKQIKANGMSLKLKDVPTTTTQILKLVRKEPFTFV